MYKELAAGPVRYLDAAQWWDAHEEEDSVEHGHGDELKHTDTKHRTLNQHILFIDTKHRMLYLHILWHNKDAGSLALFLFPSRTAGIPVGSWPP